GTGGPASGLTYYGGGANYNWFGYNTKGGGLAGANYGTQRNLFVSHVVFYGSHWGNCLRVGKNFAGSGSVEQWSANTIIPQSSVESCGCAIAVTDLQGTGKQDLIVLFTYKKVSASGDEKYYVPTYMVIKNLPQDGTISQPLVTNPDFERETRTKLP